MTPPLNSLDVANAVVLAQVIANADEPHRRLILEALSQRQIWHQEAAATLDRLIDPTGEYLVVGANGTPVLQRQRRWRDRREFNTALATLMLRDRKNVGYNRQAREWLDRVQRAARKQAAEAEAAKTTLETPKTP